MNPRKLLQKALSSPANLRFEEACALVRAFGFHPFKPVTYQVSKVPA